MGHIFLDSLGYIELRAEDSIAQHEHINKERDEGEGEKRKEEKKEIMMMVMMKYYLGHRLTSSSQLSSCLSPKH